VDVGEGWYIIDTSIIPDLYTKGVAMAAEVGQPAPDFTLPSTHDSDITLSAYRGQKNVILSFHVLDFTGG
jgi:peroxiredoxin